MTDAKVYWRDKVTQLLGWATGLVFIFIGWSIDQHDKFELGPWSQGNPSLGETRDAAVRAVFLIVFSTAYAIVLPVLIRRIYHRFLREGTDETVISERLALGYAVFLSALTLLVALLTSYL
jgi:hypothetical protein